MKNLLIRLLSLKYRFIWRPIFFTFESERIHLALTGAGERIGRSRLLCRAIGGLLAEHNERLVQTIAGITFPNPIGLAAGFDYRAQLPNLLPALGFGLGTIGTITNQPCAGNPPPRLGRLVQSRALLVNKGFRNEGIRAVTAKLLGQKFEIPTGLSIGQTNTAKPITSKEAAADIIEAFVAAEVSNVPFSYYELNISCPNLAGPPTFYHPAHLQELLARLTELKLTKPLFIKMPIEKTDDETRAMLTVIAQFPVTGVIFGNLQKDRRHPALVPAEVIKCGRGNFSGKPTFRRSNELIALAFREYGDKLIIVGCGGVFNAADAYTKIRLGASLVQLITGLIFEGPHLAAQINRGLLYLLSRDGFSHLSEAVGADFN